MIYKHYHINKFLGFFHGQCLRLVDRVVMSPFRTVTPFSSLFLEVTHFESKGALPCKGAPFLDLNDILPY